MPPVNRHLPNDLAADHDPGFDLSMFAEAFAAIDRLPDSLFQSYGMSPEDMSAPGHSCTVAYGLPQESCSPASGIQSLVADL
jgi:hypothetical protein